MVADKETEQEAAVWRLYMARLRVKMQKNRTGIGIIAFVILMLLAAISYKMIELRDQHDDKALKIERLQAKIDEQEERAIDINNLRAYVQTKRYIEEIAREKLGLVYEDDYIFQAEEKDGN